MDTPFISICIPTYKRTALLKKLLDSIAIQSFKNFEILMNDNSPDNSVKELVATYKPQLAIQYEKNEPATNAVENGIKVMRRAKAPWVKIMHDDDWFATADALQQFADAATTSGKDFIFCASNAVELTTNVSKPEYLSDENKKALEDSPLCLFFLNTVGHPSAVMNKKDVSIEYDKNYNWVLDIDFYMRYLTTHQGFHYIDKPLVNIGKSEGQESFKYYKNGNVEIPEYFSLLAKYESNLPLKNEYVFHLVWNMLKRYHIKNTSDFQKYNYNGKLPDEIEDIIRCQKYIPNIVLKQPPWSKVFMRRCYKKLRLV